MRKQTFLLPLLWLTALAPGAFAEPFSEGALPAAVRKALQEEIGQGKVIEQESIRWGEITIYRFRVRPEGKPVLELEIAENGKVIREDVPESEE